MHRAAPFVSLIIVIGFTGLALSTIPPDSTGSQRDNANYLIPNLSRQSTTMNKKMTREEMILVLQEGKRMGYLTNLPDDPSELEKLAEFLRQQTVYFESPTRGASGSQQFVLRPSSSDSNQSLQVLPSFLEGPEWSAIFTGMLGTSYIENNFNTIEEYWDAQAAYFRSSIPDYPMLGRIWDTYADVEYQSHEIFDLKHECLQLLNKATDANARKGLEKIIAACDKALEKSMGLSLLAD